MTAGEPSSPFFAASREISFHSREGSREAAKTRRRQGPWVPSWAKTSPVKWERADFEPVSAAEIQIGDDGHLGGFEALRLV